jgi:hypothetical protein
MSNSMLGALVESLFTSAPPVDRRKEARVLHGSGHHGDPARHRGFDIDFRKDITVPMPTIAEVLHCAADYYLLEYVDYAESERPNLTYSCVAAYEAARDLVGLGRSWLDLTTNVEAGLKEMGMDTFDDVPDEHRQAYRYAWLKFAALIAEEQGV